MDIYLDDMTSLLLTRATATNQGIGLVRCGAQKPLAPDLRRTTLERLGIPGLLSFLRVPEDRRIGIVVPRATDRVRAKGIRCSLASMPRGEAPFLLLVSKDPQHPSPVVPDDSRVYVQSPANIVLGMAQRVRRQEISGTYTNQQATLMMVKLCLELCGTYRHDPFCPLNGTVTYNVPPVLTSTSLMDFLKPGGTEKGLALARTAAALTYDLSGSPQESFLGPALFFSNKLGGLELCDFAANKPLELTPDERASIGHRTITPDFTLTDYNSVVEYLGAIHNEGKNPEVDHVRSLDYSTLGRREFGFWYDDVRTQDAFMASAMRVVAAIEQKDGSGVRRKVARLMRSPTFQKKQNALFAVFRPWLR